MRYLTYENLWANGRLGNQLWQIASTAGLAHTRGLEPRFPKWEYQQWFSCPDAWFVDELPADREDLGTDYLQQYRHFAELDVEVRSWLEMHHILHRVAPQIPWFFEDGHFTALHIRRGDYVGLPNHFPLTTKDYYSHAIDLVLNENDGTQFVVFSDDIPWCQANLDNAFFRGQDAHFVSGAPRPVELADRVAAGPPTDQLDLYLMTLCNEHIISNSTFCWWGAFLSDNRAPFYPSPWFGPALADIEWRAMFPKGWRELDSC